MKVYITKHALTQGIEEKEAKTCEDINHPDMISILNVRYNEFYHKEGKEWHKTKEAAIQKAEEMRIKKIKSLEKQIEKLKELKF